MSEASTELDHVEHRPDGLIGRALYASTYYAAILGGFMMVAIAVMVVISVTGRWVASAPILGDFEMVAMGTAIAVSLFLPYCHIRRGNVIVDLFMAWAPTRVQSGLDFLGSLALAAIAGGLTWRMYVGIFDVYAYSETTYILALPLWLAFPFMIFSFGLLTATCLYTAYQDAMRAFK